MIKDQTNELQRDTQRLQKIHLGKSNVFACVVIMFAVAVPLLRSANNYQGQHT